MKNNWVIGCGTANEKKTMIAQLMAGVMMKRN